MTIVILPKAGWCINSKNSDGISAAFLAGAFSLKPRLEPWPACPFFHASVTTTRVLAHRRAGTLDGVGVRGLHSKRESVVSAKPEDVTSHLSRTQLIEKAIGEGPWTPRRRRRGAVWIALQPTQSEARAHCGGGGAVWIGLGKVGNMQTRVPGAWLAHPSPGQRSPCPIAPTRRGALRPWGRCRDLQPPWGRHPRPPAVNHTNSHPSHRPAPSSNSTPNPHLLFAGHAVAHLRGFLLSPSTTVSNLQTRCCIRSTIDACALAFRPSAFVSNTISLRLVLTAFLLRFGRRRRLPRQHSFNNERQGRGG